MLDLDPSQRLQLSDFDPSVLWRDREGGGREGLAFTTFSCSSPACACRDTLLGVWRVEPDATGVERKGRVVSFRRADGKLRAQEKVLDVDVDFDSGELSVRGDASEPWAVDWLRAELGPGGVLLAELRRRVEAEKVAAPPPRTWRDTDWSFWKGQSTVAWSDLFPDDREGAKLLLDAQHYLVSDAYCIVPGCPCTSVSLLFFPDTDECVATGAVWLDTRAPEHPVFDGHGPNLALLERLWAAWCEQNDPGELLAERIRRVREIAPELRAHLEALRAPKKKAATAGPNERCPCGSGKKYKRCCGAK